MRVVEGSIKPVRQRRTLRIVGVLGAAVVAGLVIWFVVASLTPKEDVARGRQFAPVQLADGRQEVRFTLVAPNASDVSVLGDFNRWEPTTLSDADGDGVWSTSVFLAPGRYEYAFLIDGRWWGHDPLAEEYVQSFGEYSPVRYIRGGAGA